MNYLTQEQLLEIWEQGLHQSPLQFALNLVSASFPSMDYNHVQLLPIGKRDDLLLRIRQAVFSSKFTNVAVCPSCNEKVEWEMNIDDFELSNSRDLLQSDQFSFKKKGYIISFRLPNSDDILKMPVFNEEEDSQKWLISRCVLKIKLKKKELLPDNLPEDVLKSLADYIAEKDRVADIRMLLSCPVCAHQWEIAFDIVDYFWTEINAWAKGLLHEITVLAFNFGWSEKQILALSPRRRRLYLEMIGT